MEQSRRHEIKHKRGGHRPWSYSDVTSKFVRLGRRIPAVLYEASVEEQTEGRNENGEQCSNIAVLVMHSDEDYLTFSTGPELARRGIRTLCANVMNKEGILYTQNEKMECVKEAIEYLRSLEGVEKIILMGHSGGASLLTAYQCMAENGKDVFSGPEKLFPWHAEHELPPADGLMLLDANWGNAVMQLFSLDPAVTDEKSGKNLDASIDLFNPENGFDPNGSTFSDEFIRRFQTAQGQRNMRLVAAAQERLEKINSGEGLYEDDEPFIIPGASQSFFNNRLFAQDIRLMSHTKEPQLLIHADGSITEEIVHSVRHAENPVSMTGSFWEGARILSVKNYLSSYAVRTEEDFGYDEDHVWGIDWSSTYAAAPGNVQGIHVPTLVMGMTGGWEYLAAETIYNMSAAEDKHLSFVEGASHKLKTAKEYEEYRGQFGDTLKLVHDYVADWLTEEGRF
ncbi:MAG: alpha/beta hydrolase [Dorea sp.]